MPTPTFASVPEELVPNRSQPRHREVQGLHLAAIQEPIPDTLQTRGQVHSLDAAEAQKVRSNRLQVCHVPQVDHLEPGAGALAKFVCKRCGASLFVNVLYSHARCIYIYCLIYDGYTGDTHARCIYIYYLIYDRYTGDRTKKKQQNICSD